MGLLKRHPFTLFALAGVVLVVLVWITGARHDSCGALGLLYYLGAFFALPFFAIELLLKPLVPAEFATGVVVVSVALGFLLCAWLDRLLQRRRDRKKAAAPEEPPGK